MTANGITAADVLYRADAAVDADGLAVGLWHTFVGPVAGGPTGITLRLKVNCETEGMQDLGPLDGAVIGFGSESGEQTPLSEITATGRRFISTIVWWVEGAQGVAQAYLITAGGRLETTPIDDPPVGESRIELVVPDSETTEGESQSSSTYWGLIHTTGRPWSG